MVRSRTKKLILGAAAALALSCAARATQATIVERVVAVVGERPILLSDLKRRARPYVMQIVATVPNPTQQAAQQSEMFRELLNRMIDERLEEQAADKARLSVTSEEIERGLKNKADSLNISVKELLGAAKNQGLAEADYRDEVRRQLLEGKLIQLRVMNRVRVSDDDARNAYESWKRQVGGQEFVEARILARQLAPGITPQQVAEEEKLAASIVAKARGGSDFCALVKQHSQNVQTRANCGSSGLQPISALLGPLQSTIAGLKEGQISEPVRVGNEAIVIIQLARAPHTPAFDQVRREMQERAMGEVIDKQRKQWLEELRRGVYVDVRL